MKSDLRAGFPPPGARERATEERDLTVEPWITQRSSQGLEVAGEAPQLLGALFAGQRRKRPSSSRPSLQRRIQFNTPAAFSLCGPRATLRMLMQAARARAS
jgi:hypothetical protein